MARQPPSRIHAGLTRKRELVGTAYLADAGLRREYDEQIAPRTGAALGKIFAEVAPDRTGVKRALDLGAGTGAAGRAVRAWFGEDVEVTSVDRVGAPGVIAADLRRRARPAGVAGPFDLVVAAHLLNELSATMDLDARAALVSWWCEEWLAPQGRLVLVEPALRQTSRDLLGVRDRLIAAGLHVVAPCFFRGPCPALARERDWCHDAAPWDDAATGAARSRVDFSFLVVVRGAGAAADPRAFRVVSDAMPDKGRSRLFVCGAAGRHQLVRLDRDRRDGNVAFDRAARGDVLVVEGDEPSGDGRRVGAAAAVRIERPVRR